MIRDERGSALVEMALVMPLLLLLLCGMVELGRIFHTYIVVQQTARDAVRYASIGSNDSEIGNIIKKDMESLDLSKMSYVIKPSVSDRKTGEAVTVEVSYSHSLLVPYLKGVIPDPIVLHSELSMRYE